MQALKGYLQGGPAWQNNPPQLAHVASSSAVGAGSAPMLLPAQPGGLRGIMEAHGAHAAMQPAQSLPSPLPEGSFSVRQGLGQGPGGVDARMVTGVVEVSGHSHPTYPLSQPVVEELSNFVPGASQSGGECKPRAASLMYGF